MKKPSMPTDTGKVGHAPKGSVRHCPYCGDDMGFIENRYYDRGDPCGKPECNREARDSFEQERQEAHDRLDDERGW